jgi:hypothetical protein
MKYLAAILLVVMVTWLPAQTLQPPANTGQVTNMVANGYYVSPAGLGDFYNYVLVPYVANNAGGNSNALTAGQSAVVSSAVTNILEGTNNSVSGHVLTLKTNYSGGSSGTTYTFTPTNRPVGTAWITNGATVFYPTNLTVGTNNLDFPVLPVSAVVTNGQSGVTLSGKFIGDGSELAGVISSGTQIISVLSTPKIVLYATNSVTFTATNLVILGTFTNFAEATYDTRNSSTNIPSLTMPGIYFVDGTNLTAAYATNAGPLTIAAYCADPEYYITNLTLYGYSGTNVGNTIDFYSQTILVDSPTTNRQVASRGYVDAATAVAAANWASFPAASAVNINGQPMQWNSVFAAGRDASYTNQNGYSITAWGQPVVTFLSPGGSSASGTNFTLYLTVQSTNLLFSANSAGMTAPFTVQYSTNNSQTWLTVTPYGSSLSNGLYYVTTPIIEPVALYRAIGTFGSTFNPGLKIYGDVTATGSFIGSVNASNLVGVLPLANLPSGILTNGAPLNAALLTNTLPMGALTTVGTNLQGGVLVRDTNSATGRSYTNSLTLSGLTVTGTSSLPPVLSSTFLFGISSGTLAISSGTNYLPFYYWAGVAPGQIYANSPIVDGGYATNLTVGFINGGTPSVLTSTNLVFTVFTNNTASGLTCTVLGNSASSSQFSYRSTGSCSLVGVTNICLQVVTTNAVTAVRWSGSMQVYK